MAIAKSTSLLLPLLGATLALANVITSRTPQDGDYYDQSDREGQLEDIAEAAALGMRIERAHGIIGCLTFAFLFPLGAITVRLLPSRLAVPLHATIQVLALCFAIVTLGMGIWMAQGTEYIETYHAIIGIIAISAVCIQPITGLIQHRLFKKKKRNSPANIRPRRTALSYVHIWWGIAFITLGIINGGFGLQLNGAEQRFIIVYGVFAGVIWVVWMGISFLSQCLGGFRRSRRNKAVKEERTEREVKPSEDVRLTEYA
ncbi:unnamed protein product [Discula destructiva]